MVSRAKRIVGFVLLLLVPAAAAADSIQDWKQKVDDYLKGNQAGSAGSQDPCDRGMSLLGVPYEIGGGMFGGLRADSEYVQTYLDSRTKLSPLTAKVGELDGKISSAKSTVQYREQDISDANKEIAALRRRKDESEEARNRTQKLIEEWQTKVGRLETEVAQAKAELSQAQSQRASVEGPFQEATIAFNQSGALMNQAAKNCPGRRNP